ncbi:flavodoxin [Bacillus sp. V3B]|uniref:flavodoxin n=1 Tax=Bacillus sp. V3B TaxID=2804915 RepID=UPI002108775A|nr:flavodoxin [Bacillus sp. V3B]MCQ6275217.1 flavodoxin [Bacillus sp. V3B]
MSEMIMVFASMTGNTEEMANAIAEGIRQTGNDLEINDIIESPSASRLEKFDGILLGSYTWGEGDLPDEFLDLYEEMDEINLSGKKAVVFGSGDTAYDQYAGAVDILIEKLKERGAEIVLEGLKVDTSPSPDDIENCKEFGKEFARHLNK